MKRTELPINHIVDDYIRGLSSIQIATKYNTSKPIILRRLKEQGVIRRTLSDACRRHSLNVHFFDKINSEAKAYWLGFLLADGNIQYCGRYKKGRMVRLALKESDREHLVKYFKDLESSHDLVYNKKCKSFWAKFTSIPMALSLEDKGWHEFKKDGDIRILTEVPQHLQLHLVRGLLDGDGWIFERRDRQNQWILGFCNLHKPVVKWVHKFLYHIGIEGTAKINSPKNNRVWRFAFANRTVPDVLNKLYGESTRYLERKKSLATKAYQQVVVRK